MMSIHLPWRLCHLTLKLDEEWRRESAKAWKVVIATGLADFQPLSSLPYPYLSSFTFKRPGRITRKTQQKWWDPKQQRNLQELFWRIPILEIISWGYKWQNSDGTKCSNRTNDAIHDCGRTISEIVLPEWHRRVSNTRKPNLGTRYQSTIIYESCKFRKNRSHSNITQQSVRLEGENVLSMEGAFAEAWFQ